MLFASFAIDQLENQCINCLNYHYNISPLAIAAALIASSPPRQAGEAFTADSYDDYL